MSWQRIFDNPTKTDEQVKFERAVKRAAKLLREFAAGADDHEDRRKHFWVVEKAISKAEQLARWVEPEEREQAWALRAQLGPAEDSNAANRTTERDAERIILLEQERAGRPAPGSYKHELELMRGRR